MSSFVATGAGKDFVGYANCNQENEIENVCTQVLEESVILDNDRVQAAVEVDYANLTIEEMEKRFENGEVVENEDIAYALYCKYARAKGFNVRKGRNIPFKNGDLRGKIFVCSREGKKDEKRSKVRAPKYQKTDSRCMCLAMLKVNCTRGGPWKVTEFQKEHNHDMFAPDQTYLLKTSRNITKEQELVLTSMLNSRVPVSRAIKFLENVAGGRDKVGFIPSDAYNCVSRVKRKTKIENGGDSFELLQHLLNRANDEPDFYSDVDVDDDKRLMNFFIRDYRSLVDYGCFSDVLSIDTTYRTNNYDMICALFVGINHHDENVLFGFALLSDETEETFTWLFKTFLKSMGNKQPGIVYTDQCQAMMNAVQEVFPKSIHKLCQWHINQNAPSHFGSLNNDSHFKYLWDKCMSFCESEEQFEATWKEMVETYKVDSQSWFNTMYNLRHKWATAFSNTVFSAGLMTTSRSEGANSALKRYTVNRTCSLLNCVNAYEKVQDDWRLKEKEKDTLCHHNKPALFNAHNPLLKQVSDIYTHNMFKVFEKELKDTMGLEISENISSTGSWMVYKVRNYGGKWFRTVEYDSENLEIKCSCHKFETVGILCSHILKVFAVVNVCLVPEKYIIHRWTKLAKGDLCDAQSGSRNGLSENCNETSYIYEMAFVSHAGKEFRDVSMQGKKHVETRKIIMKHIESAKKELNAWFQKNEVSGLASDDQDLVVNHGEEIDINQVRDPLVAKSRGVTVKQRHFEDTGKKGKGKGKGKGKEKVVTSNTDTSSKRKGKEKVVTSKTDTSRRDTSGVKRKNQKMHEAPGSQLTHGVSQIFQQFPSAQTMFGFQNVAIRPPPTSSYMGSFVGGTSIPPLQYSNSATSVHPFQYPSSFANIYSDRQFNTMGNKYPEKISESSSLQQIQNLVNCPNISSDMEY